MMFEHKLMYIISPKSYGPRSEISEADFDEDKKCRNKNKFLGHSCLAPTPSVREVSARASSRPPLPL